MNDNDPSSYLAQGPFAEAGPGRPLLASIAREGSPGGRPEPRAIAEAIRGLMVHVFWRKAYGLEDEPARARAETNLRSLAERLALVSAAQAAQGRPPADARPLPPASKTVGNCRDFSLLFAAALREAGIPARPRCGFGMYFAPSHGEDHWVVERWVEAEGRWAISDPQLDGLMAAKLGIAFDPMDLPDGAFLSGGEAWLACRAGDDPARYGIFDMGGWDFVKGDFVRDLASLGGLVLLPWDLWGIMRVPHAQLTAADLEALDEAARLAPMRARLTRAQAEAILADPRFAVPRRISAWLDGEEREIDLGPLLGLDWPDGKRA